MRWDEMQVSGHIADENGQLLQCKFVGCWDKQISIMWEDGRKIQLWAAAPHSTHNRFVGHLYGIPSIFLYFTNSVRLNRSFSIAAA